MARLCRVAAAVLELQERDLPRCARHQRQDGAERHQRRRVGVLRQKSKRYLLGRLLYEKGRPTSFRRTF